MMVMNEAGQLSYVRSKIGKSLTVQILTYRKEKYQDSNILKWRIFQGLQAGGR